MSHIVSIHARQILDSRGNPTVEADVMTENGEFRPLRKILLDKVNAGLL